MSEADIGEKTVAVNRRARHDYSIEETVEAGLVLQGSEIKSVRAGQASLREGYASIHDGEAWLHNVHIAPYKQASFFDHVPVRDRKLLLHKDEIRRLADKVAQKGLTLVPLRIYLKRGRAKLELGLARGRREYDKREAIATREARRDIERALRDRDRERPRD